MVKESFLVPYRHLCAKFMGYLSIKFSRLHNKYSQGISPKNYRGARSAITYLACLSGMPFSPLYQRQRACCHWWSSPWKALFLQALQAPAMCCLQSESHQLLVKEWTRKLKTIAPNAKFFCALRNVLKHTIHRWGVLSLWMCLAMNNFWFVYLHTFGLWMCFVLLTLPGHVFHFVLMAKYLGLHVAKSVP